MTKRPSIQSALRVATTFGCERPQAMRASVSIASRPNSRTTQSNATFSATRRPSTVSRAANTSEKAPFPIERSRRYFPRRVPRRRTPGKARLAVDQSGQKLGDTAGLRLADDLDGHLLLELQRVRRDQ